ncbi:FAD-binding protein [Microbacterium elymi]|uniref:FAD-binding protein n=1 Tax=Microbacterium elymi TaxID=2909587 RepID=A0ABY5NMZ5_9MICO|nr:FAD-binding protein [Microbacterium elymi]UUT36481.1 FAD-binding protein [Microbacterium elymi]
MTLLTSDEAAQPLRDALGTRVLFAADAGYDAARTAWNLAVDQRPFAVALPETEAEVAAVVAAAAASGLRVTAQSTGHGAGALRGADLSGTVIVSLRGLRGVDVDPAARTATVRGSTAWHDLLPVAAEHGLTGLHGSAADISVIGYTLTGGISFYGRRHGLATNTVRAARVVTADGSILTASATENPDLFWALRGGAGAFGVVVELEIDLLPIADVFAGMLLWDGARAVEVAQAWAQWTASAPESATTALRIMHFPPIPEPAAVPVRPVGGDRGRRDPRHGCRGRGHPPAAARARTRAGHIRPHARTRLGRRAHGPARAGRRRAGSRHARRTGCPSRRRVRVHGVRGPADGQRDPAPGRCARTPPGRRRRGRGGDRRASPVRRSARPRAGRPARGHRRGPGCGRRAVGMARSGPGAHVRRRRPRPGRRVRRIRCAARRAQAPLRSGGRLPGRASRALTSRLGGLDRTRGCRGRVTGYRVLVANQRRTPGSQASLREANRARIVTAINKHGGLTQVELAAITGLSPASVSNIVRELAGVGVLRTTPSTRSGRRASLVTFNRAVGLVAGIHVNTRHLRVIVADVNRTVLSERHMPLARDHRADNELDRATRCWPTCSPPWIPGWTSCSAWAWRSRRRWTGPPAGWRAAASCADGPASTSRT